MRGLRWDKVWGGNNGHANLIAYLYSNEYNNFEDGQKNQAFQQLKKSAPKKTVTKPTK